MKTIVFALIAITGLTAVTLQTRPASAQDYNKMADQSMSQSAPKGGIAMVQDGHDVYIYDGSIRKVIVVSKVSFGDGGKPITHVIEVDKVKD